MSSTISDLGLKIYEWKPRVGRCVGPRGETLAAIACGAALALLLFAPRDWFLFSEARGLVTLSVLIVFFVLLALYFLLVAVGHARSLLNAPAKVTEKRYRATPTRVLVLKAAGVPEDITGALENLLTAKPDDGKPHELPAEPQPEQAFIDWLARDVGLGRTRVEESRNLILKYTEVDAEEPDTTKDAEETDTTKGVAEQNDTNRVAGGAERQHVGSATLTAQTVTNGVGAAGT